jgi:hypothetical protein
MCIKESEKAREVYVQYECKETKIMYPFVCQQKVGAIQQAAATQIACMAGERPIPTSAGSKMIYCFCSPPLRCAVSKGCRPQEVRNVGISRVGGCGRKLAGSACGRKGLVGERREPAPSQMSHKTKMRKTANRKTTLKSCKEEDAQMIRWWL